MSAINPPISTGLPLRSDDAPRGPDNYLTHGRGLKSWILTLDHKRIGIMYMVTILSTFLLGGIFAMAVRTILLTPGYYGPGNPANRTDEMMTLYNHMFTLHGAVMVFLFIIPAIPAILGNFVLPMMLGAKDVAFPRLNLLSYRIFCSEPYSSSMCCSAA